MSAIDSAIADLADRQHGVVASWQLRAAGVGPGAIKCRLGDRRLRPLHRGVYALGHRRLTERGRWRAAALAHGSCASVSHRSAAALWDVRQTSRAAIDVIVPGAKRRSTPLITVHAHRIGPDDVTVVDAVPTTTVARTLLDLGEVVTPHEHRRAYERAVELRLFDARAARQLLERSNGHRAAGRLAALLASDPVPAAESRSELERMFCDLIREAGLPAPQMNVIVEGYEIDAYWPQARLVVELQGYAYHHDREAFERDNAKQAELRLAGFEFLPFTYRKVADQPTWVAEAVRTVLARHGVACDAATRAGHRG